MGSDLCYCSLFVRFYRISIFARSTSSNSNILHQSYTSTACISCCRPAYRYLPSGKSTLPAITVPVHPKKLKARARHLHQHKLQIFSGFWSLLWPAALGLFQSSLTLAHTYKQHTDLSRIIYMDREHRTLMPTFITSNHF